MATTIENGVLNLDGTIKLRGGTYTALSTANPLLAAREIMVEVDTGKIKVGDGVHNWNDLSYSGEGMDWPENDDKVYVIKNGAFVEATVVAQPSEWDPEIDYTANIVLTVDADMTPYQFTGNNVEVNSGE